MAPAASPRPPVARPVVARPAIALPVVARSALAPPAALAPLAMATLLLLGGCGNRGDLFLEPSVDAETESDLLELDALEELPPGERVAPTVSPDLDPGAGALPDPESDGTPNGGEAEDDPRTDGLRNDGVEDDDEADEDDDAGNAGS